MALRLALPVEDDRIRRRIAVIRQCVDEESLAVGRDHILLSRLNGVIDLGSKQRASRAEGHGSVRGKCHRHCCQSLIGSHIKKFATAQSPSHLLAAARRHLDPITRAGKPAQVDFVTSGFIRLVRDPLAVRRKLAVAFAEFRRDERLRRTIADERNVPKIGRPGSRPGIEEKRGRPGRRPMGTASPAV